MLTSNQSFQPKKTRLRCCSGGMDRVTPNKRVERDLCSDRSMLEGPCDQEPTFDAGLALTMHERMHPLVEEPQEEEDTNSFESFYTWEEEISERLATIPEEGESCCDDDLSSSTVGSRFSHKRENGIPAPPSSSSPSSVILMDWGSTEEKSAHATMPSNCSSAARKTCGPILADKVSTLSLPFTQTDAVILDACSSESVKTLDAFFNAMQQVRDRVYFLPTGEQVEFPTQDDDEFTFETCSSGSLTRSDFGDSLERDQLGVSSVPRANMPSSIGHIREAPF